MIRLLLVFSLFLHCIAHAEAQQITVGVFDNPPLMYKSEEGKVGGLFIDVLEHIAENNGWKLKYKFGSSKECYEWLSLGEIDMLAESAISQQRASKYLLTNESVISTWASIYADSDTDLTSFLDLQGRRIAVITESHFISDEQQGLKKILSDLDIACEYVAASSNLEVFQLIERGEVDAGVVNRVFGDINRADHDVLQTPILFSPYRLGYAFSINSEKAVFLKRAIDHDLNILKKDNQSYYYNVLNTYFNERKSTSMPMWLWVIIAAFVLAITQLVIHVYVLKRQMVKRTKGLKDALDEIAQREQLLLLIYNHTRDFIGLLEIQDEETYIVKKLPDWLLNKVIEKNPKYSVAQILNMQLREFYNDILYVEKQETERRYRQVKRAIDTLETVFFEEDVRFPLDVFGVSESMLIPISFKGKVSHVLYVSRDVTKERKNKLAITRSEEKMRLAVQNVPVMLDAFDENGLLVVWNKRCEEITGYTAREMIGNENAFELLYPDENYRDSLLERWQKGPFDYEDESVITCKDGTLRTIAWTHRAGTNPVPGWTDWGIGIDVTEKKRAEQALRLNEQLLRSMMGNLPGMFWRLKIDEDFTMLFASEGSKDLLGLTPSEIFKKGLTPKDIILKEYQQFVKEETYRCVKEMVSGELVIPIYAEGKIKWVLDRFRPVDLGNGEIVMDGMLIDISDQIENEQRLQLAIEGAQQGMWDIDIENDTLELNQYGAEMFELDNKVQDAMNKLYALIHPEDLESTKKAFEDHLTGQSESYHREYRVMPSSGDCRWIETRGKVVERSSKGNAMRAMGTHIDITVRKEAEIALAEKERMLSNLMSNLPGMVYRCRNEEGWPILFASEGITKLTGFSAKDLKNKQTRLIDFIVESDRSHVLKETELALSEGRSYKKTFRIRSKNGDVKWVWEQGSLIEGTNVLEGFVTDITDRIENEQRLQLALEGARQGMWDVDFENDVMNLNQYATEMLGYGTNRIEGVTNKFYDILHPDDRAETKLALENHLSGVSEYYEKEYRLKTKSGDWKWIETRGRVVEWSPEGKALRAMGTHIDISTRKKIELALSENERRMSNLMSNLPGMVYRCVNDDLGTILFASNGALALTGYRPEEFESKAVTFMDITAESDRHRIWKEVEESISKNGSYTITYRLKTKGGDYKWVWQQGNLVKDIGILEGFITDITDRVESEDKLIAAVIETEDNERKRIAKELHDSLGQKLTTASLNFNSLKKDLNLEQNGLSKLLTGLDNLNSAIKDSREIAHNLMPQSIEDFGYVLAVQSMIADIEEVSGININFYDNLNGKRLEDKLEVHLYRITQEAVNNMLKYSEAKNVVIQLMTYSDDLVLTIEDDGKGFDAENALASNSSLGLKSIRNRVNSLTGNWHVDSTPNNGTLITVELPYKLQTA